MYILWIRHGYSYGNYAGQFNLDYDITDADLTERGWEQSGKLWPKIKYVAKRLKLKPLPLILTSTLSRAIQTALSISESEGDNMDVIPISFITELPYSNPYNISQNINYVDGGDSLVILKYNNPYKGSGDPKYPEPDSEMFYEIGFPNIVKELRREGYRIGPNTMIMIVSHAGFIREVTGEKVKNNGMVLQDVEITRNGLLVGDSMVVFEGFDRPKNKKQV